MNRQTCSITNVNLIIACIGRFADQIAWVRCNVVCGTWVRIPGGIKLWKGYSLHCSHRWLIVHARDWWWLKVLIEPMPIVQSYLTRFFIELTLRPASVGFSPIVAGIPISKSSSIVSFMLFVISSSVVTLLIDRLRVRGLMVESWFVSLVLSFVWIIMWDKVC